MAEDQAEADQLAGVPDYNDWYVDHNLWSGVAFDNPYSSVGIVNLIRNTEMVYKA